ncbi:phosphatase 2C-like domain-containing protein [Staphylotrichum tortipilum]|uniref:Phosphatase 2C-like domain-containing protein n=1 Tax=Staphylotrichum tortipilum TaxID=2831512 RepID=A0AAN6RQN0_9PEZI|nr:phosphatase 2C-like domain-containing protein [Staphylotrichum longicolle]
MGYVATFFHAHVHTNTQRSIAMPARAVRVAGARRPLRAPSRPSLPLLHDAPTTLAPNGCSPPQLTPRRPFHNYFVTHLPSSSLHPDSRSSAGPGHRLPRSASTPHTPGPGSVPAAAPPNMPSRDLTVVRIPLRSAKHHFGVSNSRGQRVYNEDTNQAGTIHMPAFAKRVPISLVRHHQVRAAGESTNPDSALGDPQIFYFGVFDGHGGSECSEFLRDELHGYIEQAAADLGLKSSLKRDPGAPDSMKDPTSLQDVPIQPPQEQQQPQQPEDSQPPTTPTPATAARLEADLLAEYKRTIGGYFRRFHPSTFPPLPPPGGSPSTPPPPPTLESVLTYAFLRADLDFVTAQARKPDPDDPHIADHTPLNRDEILGSPHLAPSGHGIGGSSPARFKGGSTASVALISTPTPAPFWHPAAHATLVVAHVGDTRVLLCETATGAPVPVTRDHHPSSPGESRRLRRYVADSLVTDSFGEERIQGLANSRAFGDMQSKRVGVSAEPELARVEMRPAEFAFLVLVSDGVSGTLGDQEIVDVVKEAGTPEEGARKVVEYATEVSGDGDNATCLVVRLGGWERRSEGGVGSLGTREMREMRRAEALDPRRRGR